MPTHSIPEEGRTRNKRVRLENNRSDLGWQGGSTCDEREACHEVTQLGTHEALAGARPEIGNLNFKFLTKLPRFWKAGDP